MKKYTSIFLKVLAVIAIASVAWSLRWQAVTQLPVDFDEDDYMRAAQEFTHLIRTDNWSGFLETNYRTEHPPLQKMLYGVGLLTEPESPLIADKPTSAPPDQSIPRELLHKARTVGAVEGTLTVLLLSLVNPLGGLLLAYHTFTIKYVSQVMLEALPALTSLITVLTYIRYKKRKDGIGWLITSSVFLGLTAASKYIYCLVAIAILIDWFFVAKENDDIKRFIKNALLWGVLGILVFFAFDPYLWVAPLERLQETIFYHAGYATGANEVDSANFPTWQPLRWLVFTPAYWHEGVFSIAPDAIITILALFGLTRLWKKERVYAIWLGIAILFLLAWPTKWPQYILVLTAPLSLAAAETIGKGWENVKDGLSRFKSRRDAPKYINRREAVQSIPWLVPGVIFFIALTLLPIGYQIAMSTTNLSGRNLRDGLQGGIEREFWGGITGEIIPPEAGANLSTPEVAYVGSNGYRGSMRFLNQSGITYFGYFWTILSVLLQAVLGIGVAMLLWQKRDRVRKIWQTIFILPWAIPEAIAALLWLNIFAPFNGWLALAVKEYGEGVPFGFMMGWEKDPDLTMVVLLISALWYGFPFMMLAASAGLKFLPKEVYDAAALDGAGAIETFRYVTWPLLQPLVLPSLLVRAIFAFNQFYLFQMMLPYYFRAADNMMTLSSLSYYVLFDGSEFAFSATLNIIALVLLGIFVVLLNRWSKASEGVTYA
jgi:ABC-type sugar transport system permease subunit